MNSAEADGPGRELVAGQLRAQAAACAAMGSALYGLVLTRAADAVASGEPPWPLLAPHVAPGRGDALALRLMAAVHRLVLSGAAPGLAACYPSAGGDGSRDPWPEFRRTLERSADDLRPLLARHCQTNEVGRSAPLLFGFLEIAARTGWPLRVLEIGASAGLNLLFDRFAYGGGGAAWGDPASPVDLRGLWAEAPPCAAARLEVVERAGCDRAPLDPGRSEDRLALASSVWADQVARLARLRAALRLAEEVAVPVETAAAVDWVARRLADCRPGRAHVVVHSIVFEYLSAGEQRDLVAVLEAAGSRASPQAPLAWLRLEPVSELRAHAVTLRLWPGGEDRMLAVCGAHGQDVRVAGGGD